MTRSLSDLRQVAAEFLGAAVLDLFSGAYLVNQQVTEFGFFYDVIAEQPIDAQALVFLEEKMRGSAKQIDEVRIVEMMRENGAAFFEHHKQPFIAQRVLNTPENIVSIFQLGNFSDFVNLPVQEDDLEAPVFKLLRVESTYYFLPGEGNISVTRIHGTACRDKYALKKLVKSLEAAKKKDHQVMGPKLGFFARDESTVPSTWYWLPKGARAREMLLDLWKKTHLAEGFQWVVSPPLLPDSLVAKMGDEELPLCEINGVDYALPEDLSLAHAALFARQTQNLLQPVRYAECAYVVNRGKKTLLEGIHSSCFAYVDQAHIFCTPQQVEKELISSLQFIDKIIKMFSFEYHWYLKGRGQHFAGTPNRWNKSTECFAAAFEKCGQSYEIDEGEYAFRGPQAQVKLIDSFGREWEGPSIGFDFNTPERLNLRYQDEKGQMQKPLMLVQTIYGSLERFTAILVEHDGFNKGIGSQLES